MRAEQVEALWERFLATRDPGARKQLIDHYVPFLEQAAHRLASRYNYRLEHGELVSEGFFGLAWAIDHFDPGKNTKFTTFATDRIDWAIRDALKSPAWETLPREVRSKINLVCNEQEHLTARLGREATLEEVAAATGLEVRVVNEVVSGLVARAQAASKALGGVRRTGLGNTGPISDRYLAWLDEMVPNNAPDPQEAAEFDDLRQLLAAAIADLDERERFLLGLHYGKGMTLAESAKELGIGATRANQIHSAVMCRIRESLTAAR